MEIMENGGFKFADVKSEDIHYMPNFVSEAEEDRLLEHVYAAPKPKWRQLANRRLQNWGGAVMTGGGGGEDKPQQQAGQGCLIQDGERLPKWLDECIDKIMALNGGDDVPTSSGLQSGVPSFPAQRRPNHVLINEYRPGQGIMPHTDGPAFFPLISTLSLGSHTLLNFYEEEHAERQQQHHEHGQQREEQREEQKREHENGDGNGSGKGREDEEQEGGERQPQFPAAAAAAADESNTERRRIGSSSSRRPVGSLLLEPRSLVLISGQAYRWLHGIEELETDTIVDARRTLLNWSQLGQPLPAEGTVKMERGTRISWTIRNVPRVKRLCLLPAFSHRK